MGNYMELMVVIAEIGVTIGFIGALLVILHNVMKKWTLDSAVKAVKESVIPELEKSMTRTVSDTIDITMDKTVKMVEKMTEEVKKQYDY